MNILRRITLAIALVLIFAAGVNAQDTCKVKVRIMAFKWDNSKEVRYDILTAEQLDWWNKEGQKKFPKICITTEKGVADYLLAWTSTAETKTWTYTAPVTSTTQTNGTVNATSTQIGNGGGTVYTNGSYSGTSSTTTYEQRQSEWTYTYANAFVSRLGPPIEVDGEKMRKVDGLPIHVEKHRGQWRWSKPDKDAFEKAMEFINKQLK